ncbi:MAG: hypothetical protein ACXAEU_08775 [Candidatus Hodarchaeales archaeon]
MSVDGIGSDSDQVITVLKKQQEQIKNLQKQLGKLNDRIAEILEDKISRIDKAIQLQLEKFLSRVRLQNVRLNERLKKLEGSTSTTTAEGVSNSATGLTEIKTLVEGHSKNISELENNFVAMNSERKQEMDKFKSKLELLVRSIDEAINNAKSQQQELNENLQERFVKFTNDIDEKLELNKVETGRDLALEQGINLSSSEFPSELIETEISRKLGPLLAKVTSLENLVSELLSDGTSSSAKEEEEINTKMNELAQKLEKIEKEGIGSYIGLNMDMNDRIAEIERKIDVLPPEKAIGDELDGSLVDPNDTTVTKLTFYENVVADLTDQLQVAIKQINELNDEIKRREKQESELHDLKRAHAKIRDNFKSIQLEHETLKIQLEEKNKQLVALAKRLGK